jgi:branched-chain amino acid transport system ATP-binding protein
MSWLSEAPMSRGPAELAMKVVVAPTVVPAVLTIANAAVVFGALRAVDGVSLMLTEGERHGLIGTNGAGKTTLFNAITGEVPLAAGSVAYRGRDISRLRPHVRARLGIGRTFQTSLTFLDRTVRENLLVAVTGSRGPRFGLRLRRAHREHLAAADAVAQRFVLADVLDARVDTLSYGRQREVEIAMALASAADLLLLDEPAAGLSPQSRQHLLGVLRALPRTVTMLFVEHDMDVALSLADRLSVMRDGTIAASGTPAEIRANALVREIYLGRGH